MPRISLRGWDSPNLFAPSGFGLLQVGEPPLVMRQWGVYPRHFRPHRHYAEFSQQ
jgi:hypothetical protein